MKKVLSLLLVCTMIFSLAAIGVVNAAGEGYTLVAAQVGTKKVGPSTKLNFDTAATTYNSYTHYTDATWEKSEEDVAIALQISTNTAASGGYILIGYDKTKVTPAAIKYEDGAVYGQTYTALADGGVFSVYDWVQTAGTATIVQSTAANAVEEDNLIVTWTGAMSAGQAIAYVTFFCNNGVTTDDFDADTFKISEDAAFAAKYNRFNGGASLDYQGTTYKLNDGTLTTSLTYPNSDKTTGGSDVPVDWKTTVGTEAPAEASFDAADLQFKKDPAAPEKAVQKKVTVFAKNTTGAKLLSETYGVQIGKAFYPGVGDVAPGQYWAVILVDTDGTFLSETSYSYTAKVGSEEAAAGTVNVQ